MNELINQLRESINERTFVETKNDGYGKFSFMVSEEDPSNRSADFSIIGCNNNTLPLKIESVQCPLHPRTKCWSISPVLNPKKEHLCESCDYVIFTVCYDKVFCLLLENKSHSFEHAKVKRQLEKTKLFCDYLLALMKYYVEFSMDDIEYCYLRADSRASKRKAFKHNKNEPMKVFDTDPVLAIPQINIPISTLIKRYNALLQ
jgi:hypothetical protein